LKNKGKGLAKSVAKELAALGATLVLWDEDETTCNQTKQEIEDMGGKAYAFKCDICDKEEITKVVQEVFVPYEMRVRLKRQSVR